MIAKFHTPPGCDWHQLADDVEMALEDRMPQSMRDLGRKVSDFSMCGLIEMQ